MTALLTVINGDALACCGRLPSASVQCCVTSPPYWGLRDYGHEGQLGAEATYQEYVKAMVAVFGQVRRVLKDDGTLWLNLGDCYATGAGSARSPGGKCFGKQNEAVDTGSYPVSQPNRMPQAGLKPKDLVGIPWRVAFALQADGWYLRSDIIWHKPNPMPESVTDRPTKSHEYLFLLTKSERYYYDHEAIKERAVCGWNDSEFHTGKTAGHQLGRAQKTRPSAEKGSFNGKTELMAETGQNAFRAVVDLRNKRSVWTAEEDEWMQFQQWKREQSNEKKSVWAVASQPYSEAHFATYPPDLIKPCILAGSRPGDTILDPFGGSGTTGMVAIELGRKATLIELNPEYMKLIEQRCDVTPGLPLTSLIPEEAA